jgi:hypothetical protein
MLSLFRVAGLTGWLLLVLAIVILVLTVRTILRIRGLDKIGKATFENGLNGILFWGCVSAAMGLLGQFSGLWNALGAISHAEAISPRMIAQGLMESFSTTILGLGILVVSSVVWFGLRSWARAVARVNPA